VSEDSSPVTFRLPRTTYLVFFFLSIGITPVALYGGVDHPLDATISPLTLLYLVPILAVAFIARTSSTVDARGITVRAVFGARTLDWDQMRGLSVTGRSVYAVSDAGSVRLACVRQSDLTAVAAASGGRLPELPPAPVKHAPSAHRR
jgi:Bacterial PH domain